MSRRHPPPLPARRLALAIAASLLAHGLLLLPPAAAPRQPPPQPRLQASLQPPPPAVPELKLEQPAAALPPQRSRPAPAQPVAPRPPQPAPTPSRANRPTTWTEAVRQHLQELQKRGQFYPQEAIARGQQGEVLVLLLLDENGQVGAARVEQGSGYPLLDAAALQAVRSLSALPADAPRQTLLPVRFKLR